MQAGKLRQRVTIQREATEKDQGYVADGEGGYVLRWIDIATVWAQVRPLSAKEQLFAAQLQEVRTHEITIRARSGIDASCRILFKCRPMNIRGAIVEDEIRNVMMMMVEEGVAT